MCCLHFFILKKNLFLGWPAKVFIIKGGLAYGKTRGEKRLLFYWSKLYIREIKKEEDYELLEKTIVIVITDFKIKGLENIGGHTKWKIIEEKERKKILTEKLEFHIIQLPDIGSVTNDGLLDWLYFLEEPKSGRVIEKMKENEELREAVEKLDTMSEDERMQRIADLRQKAIMDEKAIYRRGIEVGEEQGKRAGKIEGKIEIARNLLKEEADIKFISRVTGLSEEEIEKLNNDEKNSD